MKGEAKASDMPFEVISEPSTYFNSEAAAKISLDVADKFADAETYDKIEVSK